MKATILQLLRDISNDRVPIVHFNSTQLEAATLDCPQQPNALWQEVVWLGTPASRLQCTTETPHYEFQQLDKMCSLQPIHLRGREAARST